MAAMGNFSPSQSTATPTRVNITTTFCEFDRVKPMPSLRAPRHKFRQPAHRVLRGLVKRDLIEMQGAQTGEEGLSGSGEGMFYHVTNVDPCAPSPQAGDMQILQFVVVEVQHRPEDPP
ncbi:hypothetical protein M413DRAFT_293526 [Hebeloma cylindrosporum]|uniref:Uncharacterized protein n=1 Tax=Hebeloma cylindrosporum TaxID=76867 RepID=A0A0C2YXV7_HEBCY|nr:hypothetical protein M413DRAFT_293526 [Hebeloma cylindrosporum h7]